MSKGSRKGLLWEHFPSCWHRFCGSFHLHVDDGHLIPVSFSWSGSEKPSIPFPCRPEHANCCALSLFFRWHHHSGDETHVHLAHSAAGKNQSPGPHLSTQRDGRHSGPFPVQAGLVWDQGHGIAPRLVNGDGQPGCKSVVLHRWETTWFTRTRSFMTDS